MKLVTKHVDKQQDEAIVITYMEWTKQMEDIKNYILGSGKHITGYRDDIGMKQIRIDEILYFEAVGELVFAYTLEEMYEIKMRLYQIEESLKIDKIKRVSKSVLANLRKIESVRPALNGRLYAKMSGGEEILISRQYAKEVTAEILAG